MKLTLMILLIFPLISWASPDIKIVSFVMNDSQSATNTSAEICGVISDDNEENTYEKVVITSDPDRNPAIYIANVSPQGIFCHVIRTNTRRAQVELYNTNENLTRLKTKVFGLTSQ